MKHTKRMLAVLLAAALSLSLLAGCSSGEEENQTDTEAEDTRQTVQAGYEDGLTTRVAALKGPTAMGLVCLMQDNQGEDAPYQFDLYTSGRCWRRARWISPSFRPILRQRCTSALKAVCRCWT